MSPLIPGFALIFLAAVTGGVFAVPYKMQRRFAWENTWPVGFLFALIIIPLGGGKHFPAGVVIRSSGCGRRDSHDGDRIWVYVGVGGGNICRRHLLRRIISRLRYHHGDCNNRR